jgi:hypothetical protein
MMILATDFRRQAQVCARLAEDCDDRRLAERFKKMATDLLAKADDFEEVPSERVRHEEQNSSGFHSGRRPAQNLRQELLLSH